MPELPEVETIRKQLSSVLIGGEIAHVEVRKEKVWIGTRNVIGERITDITRVGKYLFVHFESGRGLGIHLKMTGRLIFDVPEYETTPHTRVVVRMADGRTLFYWDTRMFGYLRVDEDIGQSEQQLQARMGQEPWDISDTDLLRKLQNTGRSIKETLLDQTVLAGVGNIYANDGLWLAQIDPRRKAPTITLSEVKRLRTSLCTVLERGLATGGASDNSYVDAFGKRGTYQNEFLVYGRKGEPCRRCSRELVYGKVGGRGTWWCEECQS